MLMRMRGSNRNMITTFISEENQTIGLQHGDGYGYGYGNAYGYGDGYGYGNGCGDGY